MKKMFFEYLGYLGIVLGVIGIILLDQMRSFYCVCREGIFPHAELRLHFRL